MAVEPVLMGTPLPDELPPDIHTIRLIHPNGYHQDISREAYLEALEASKPIRELLDQAIARAEQRACHCNGDPAHPWHEHPIPG
jgi:hypothetical protein